MRKRLIVAALATVISAFGLVGFAAPASAYCIETGIDELGCVSPCIPRPQWHCPA